MYCKIQNKCSLLLSGHKSKRGISANYLNILTERSGMTFHFHFNGRIIGRGDLGGGMGGGGIKGGLWGTWRDKGMTQDL